jgi:hypothetical protein
MGKPGRSHVLSPLPEHIGQVEGTRGSETSHYPQEEKTTVIPRVVVSESGSRLNLCRVIAGRRCGMGVVGFFGLGCRPSRELENRSLVEGLANGPP